MLLRSHLFCLVQPSMFDVFFGINMVLFHWSWLRKPSPRPRCSAVMSWEHSPAPWRRHRMERGCWCFCFFHQTSWGLTEKNWNVPCLKQGNGWIQHLSTIFLYWIYCLFSNLGWWCRLAFIFSKWMQRPTIILYIYKHIIHNVGFYGSLSVSTGWKNWVLISKHGIQPHEGTMIGWSGGRFSGTSGFFCWSFS